MFKKKKLKPIDEEAEPMPDYSDDEIDKISDDVSESEDTSEGKQRKLKQETVSCRHNF